MWEDGALPRSASRRRFRRGWGAWAVPYAYFVPVDNIAAIAAILLALVGLVGIVIPVLPGSITVAIAALIWAIWGASDWGWLAFGLSAVLIAIGAGSSWFLTGRSLQRNEVPKWPILAGIALGLAGMFVLPGFGLPLGFALGLLLAEWYRLRDLPLALTTSLQTIKALGIGIVIELGCAIAATSILAVSIATAS